MKKTDSILEDYSFEIYQIKNMKSFVENLSFIT